MEATNGQKHLGCPLPIDTSTTQPREHTGRGSEKLLKARGPGYLLQYFCMRKISCIHDIATLWSPK